VKHLFIIIPLIAVTLAACSESGGGSADLKSNIDTVSYSIGFDMGKNLRQQKVEVNTAAYLAGLQRGLESDTAALTAEQMQTAVNAYIAAAGERQKAEMEKKGAEMKEKGSKFLAENKSKQGVVELPSGLQYKVIKEGNGPKPTANETVVINYKGTLIDGTEFDSSYKRGQPASFPVGGVIPGFTEALQLMKVGSKYEIYIPSNLAYGEAGAGDVIPPHSTLIFEIELLSIQPTPSQP
jgi:FKBP-type peptidyl-prolyl cis-trans isomerase FklB